MALQVLDCRYEKCEEGKETKCIYYIRYSREGHRAQLFLSILCRHKGKQKYSSTHS